MLSRFTYTQSIIHVLSINSTVCIIMILVKSAYLKEVDLLASSMGEVREVGSLTCILWRVVLPQGGRTGCANVNPSSFFYMHHNLKESIIIILSDVYLLF